MKNSQVTDHVALDELRHLQIIIGRQDELKAKTKSLAITLFSALTVAFASDTLATISYCEYLLVSFIMAILFLSIETIYGVTEINAEERVSNVEKCLRGQCTYDGPKICDSLVGNFNYEKFRIAMNRERTYFLYCALMIIAVLVAVSSPN